MKSFGDLRIRHQINIIVCVAAALLVMTMGAVYVAFDAIMTRMAAERFHDLAERSGFNAQAIRRSIDATDRTYAFIMEQSGYPDFSEGNLDMNRIVADAYASMSAISEDLRGVMLVSAMSADKGEDIVYFYASPDAAAKTVMTGLVQKYGLNNGERPNAFFTDALQGEVVETLYFAHISPIFSKVDKLKPGGYIVSLFDYTSVQDILRALAGTDARNTGVLLERGNILTTTKTITSSEKILLEQLFMKNQNDLTRLYRPFESVKFRNKGVIALSATVPGSDWTMGVLVSRAVIKAPILSLVWIGLIILVLGAGILAIASVATINAITRPVERMAKAMKSVENTHEYKEIAITVNNEVGMMATHINDMVHKLEQADLRAHDAEHMLYQADLARMKAEQRLYETDLAKTRAELSYYQSQINPHFLYNTLESIRSMAVVYGAEEISTLAVATAGIFRYAVRAEGAVSLQDEMTCVEEYMTILQLRFPDRYRLTLRVPDNMLRNPMVRMLLQPIVENSFKHGFARKSRNGVVHIAAKLVDGGYDVHVTDNGSGISSEILSETQARFSGNLELLSEDGDTRPHKDTNVGLENIHRRLQLTFGQESGLTVESREGFWTRVTIRIRG